MSVETHWHRANTPAPLLSDQIHLWRVPLQQNNALQQRCYITLSSDEKARADRYVFEQHQRRFAIGRAAQRQILSHYALTTPSKLLFLNGKHGKPYIENSPFQFNVSNSHELAVIAVYKGASVGVDIEHKRGITHGESIARRHFSPQECAKIATASGERWNNSFFNCWTRKEAFIKVTGEGLHRDLSSFEVSLLPEEPAQLLRVDDNHTPQEKWSIHSFDPGDGYAGALICEGPITGLEFYDFDLTQVP